MKQLWALKTKKFFGEKIRVLLAKNGLLDFSFKPKKTEKFVFFPLKKKPAEKHLKEIKKVCSGIVLEKKGFVETKKKRISFRETVKKIVSKKELSELITSFDVIGKAAIIEIPSVLKPKEKQIARALMQANQQIESVFKISEKHSGKYRIRKIKFLAGKKRFLQKYKENNCVFLVELGKVFFSPRLSHERKRIALQIKNNEVIGVFFAGVGPFAIIFAKNSPAAKVVGIELNPVAVKLFKKNVELNKVSGKITVIHGDVKNAVKDFTESFDRIVMPLPKGGEKFLGTAIKCLKKNGVLHYYRVAEKKEVFEKPLKEIKKAAQENNRKIKVLTKRIVRSFSPSKSQAVIDAKIS